MNSDNWGELYNNAIIVVNNKFKHNLINTYSNYIDYKFVNNLSCNICNEKFKLDLTTSSWFKFDTFFKEYYSNHLIDDIYYYFGPRDSKKPSLLCNEVIIKNIIE